MLVLVLGMLAAACSATSSSETTGPTSTQETTQETTEATTRGTSDGTTAPPTADSTTTTTSGSNAAPTGSCEVPAGQPFEETEGVTLEEFGEVDGVSVSGALYPHPDYEGNPWSQWGQGYALDDGRFFSAIGDHIGVDGNSYVYEYDPESNQLTMVGDILTYVDHVPGTWGYGKVHSQMVPGPCGEIYFSTYWGTYREIEFEGNYTGDILFRLDPFGRTLAPLDVPVEFYGQASMASDPASGLVYGEAIDPVLKQDDVDRGPLFAYDVRSEETVYLSPEEPHVGYRAILVDDDGAAYYSIGDGELQKYDPSSGELTAHDSSIPGDYLRAVTELAPDGSVFGVTEDPDALFAMTPEGEFEDLGPAVGYTASVALDPEGSAFYYMPGAHGNSAQWGSPLIRVDTETGEQTTVAELNDLVEEATGYTLGGTYNVVVSRDGSTVFMGVNVGEEGSDSTFSEVMLLVIELP